MSSTTSGSGWESQIAVSAGDRYALVIDNWTTGGGGYTLNLNDGTAVIFDNISPQIDQVTNNHNDTIWFDFSEQVECSSVSTSDFTLTGPNNPYTILEVYSDECAAGSVMSQHWWLRISPSIVNNGNYTLTFICTDASGNSNTLEVAFSVAINSYNYTQWLRNTWDKLWLPDESIMTNMSYSDFNITNILDSIDGYYEEVYYYNGSAWACYSTTLGWAGSDLQYANNLIEQRNIVIDEEKIIETQQKLLSVVNEPKKAKSSVILLGYLFSILGGWIGLLIGLHLKYKKNEDAGNEEKIFYYDKKSRNHGDNILMIFVVWLLFYLVYFNI